jgi:hypothetical protein
MEGSGMAGKNDRLVELPEQAVWKAKFSAGGGQGSVFVEAPDIEDALYLVSTHLPAGHKWTKMEIELVGYGPIVRSSKR